MENLSEEITFEKLSYVFSVGKIKVLTKAWFTMKTLAFERAGRLQIITLLDRGSQRSVFPNISSSAAKLTLPPYLCSEQAATRSLAGQFKPLKLGWCSDHSHPAPPPKGLTFLPFCNLRLGSHHTSCRYTKDGNERGSWNLTPVGSTKAVSQVTWKFIGKDSRCKQMSNHPRIMLEQTHPPPKKWHKSADLLHDLEVNQWRYIKKELR